jgi:tripartite-type tricarboxylate transporter receptor subunit TctC
MRILGGNFLTSAYLGLMAFTAAAFAQDDPAKYPTRAIHIIVGFTPGGGNDIIARIFGQKLSESLGQPVVIENKPGGGAIVATEYVAKSDPDGYILLVGASGAMAINPAVYARLPYDSIRDFTPGLRTRIVSADSGRQCGFADQVGRRPRRLRQG